MSTARSRPPQKKYFATVPPQEILPVVNSRYESSVRGIFIVGDVTGLPLVKVAANQGREVIERMESAGRLRSTSAGEGLDLVIVGGGPAGISAAIECEKRKLKYVLLERSQLANTVRSFPKGKSVYAEPKSIENISDLDVSHDQDRDDFLQMIERTVAERKIQFKENTEVANIARHQEHGFDVTTVDGYVFPTKQVLIAIGRQGQPRKLEVPGCDDCNKVTYRLHTKEDYQDEDVLIVGGGNSAIEAALMLKDHNRVTLSYRGDSFYRAKEENRRLLDEAIENQELSVLFGSNLIGSRDDEIDIEVDGQTQTIKNDKVIVLIGQLPPIDFLMDAGVELDGVWTARRVVWAIVGLLFGIGVYFFAKHFVLHPGEANGKIWVPEVLFSLLPQASVVGSFITLGLAPLIGGLLAGGKIVQYLMTKSNHGSQFRIPWATPVILACVVTFLFGIISPGLFTADAKEAGPGPYYLSLNLNSVGVNLGVDQVYDATTPESGGWMTGRGGRYFSNLYGLYYLLYFTLITVFGVYWAVKAKHRIIWRRNLTIILCQWTLWWGIPTFLVVLFGRNAWSSVLVKSLNAWPLNMTAFHANPANPGDPEWWTLVAVAGVVWAVVLTFVILPLFTIKFGKIYCSYICSCGALAETVGNGFRHRGPKGDWPRKLEKFGFVFILLATVATIADFAGASFIFHWYNVWVGTFLAGALAIGLYPFLGQRIWCRMWCPLAFWMNFWGRWSQFKITPEKGKCIDCNVCNQYCQMGIDIKGRALRGEPITLVDTPCVGCAECVVRCPMEILHLGDGPESQNLVTLK